MKNKQIMGIGIALLLVICSGLVLGFGVGGPYSKERALQMYPGDSAQDVSFSLQNMGAEDAVNVKATVTKGSEVISLNEPNKIYNIPANGEVIVYGKVSVPVSAQVGNKWDVEVTFATVTESGSGSFGIGSSVGREFSVIVIARPVAAPVVEEKPATDYYTLAAIVLAVLVVIVAVILLLKRKKKK
jgi:hypothetical protein